MSVKRADAKWILGSYYLSTIYREVASRSVRPINLNVSSAASFMVHLANGTEEIWLGGVYGARVATKPMNERLTQAFLNIVWSHGRRNNADDRVDMERLADKFILEHGELFAELVLTAPAKEATV